MRWIALLALICCGLACDKTIHEANAPVPVACSRDACVAFSAANEATQASQLP